MLLRPFNWISGIFIAAFLLSPIVADARQFGLKDVVPEILSFNAAVKNERPDLYRLKLRTMLADPFSFLRATAHVMYRDIEQSPELEFLSTSPQGLAGGDMHVHNFGVLYFPGKTPSYSPEDLDEARTAPLSYDLFRLCVSLAVAFEQFDQGTLKGILVSTIDGYREGLAHANAPDGPDLSFPPKLRHFLKKVAATDKTAILSKYTVAQIPNRFKKKDTFLKLSPQESDDVKSALMPFLLAKVRENHLPKDNATILDIIAREDKGLSSIGLKRYQV
ncbi:MAG TPA: DUF2252 family protein, partial [Candidatus Ozemobacteraceae bacterium]|nr:DUF2252 family protein [Candidatus Ozemobacteraceae bacterium]